MAKKLNIEKGGNLQGGLKNLINPVQPEVQVETEEKDISIKTFMVYNDDMEYIEKYLLYMGYKTKKKYTQKQAIHDAIALLKEKYPDVE